VFSKRLAAAKPPVLVRITSLELLISIESRPVKISLTPSSISVRSEISIRPEEEASRLREQAEPVLNLVAPEIVRTFRPAAAVLLRPK
jgi:hypothetical protein